MPIPVRVPMKGVMSPLSFAARGMRASLFVAMAVLALGAGGLPGAEVRPVVGPGATRDEAIQAYGWPQGQTQTDTREILTYPQGRIFLEKGKVERVDFSPNVAWPAPRPRPPGPTTTSLKKVDAPVDFWLSDWTEAKAEAERRHSRLLVLFTGIDWSPASRQFHNEVAFEPDFVNAFTGEFVFLRLDFPSRTAQPAALKEQNALLRERYAVTTYPALVMLSASGVLLGRVDLETPRAGDNYRLRVIAAVRELRDTIIARPPTDPATKVAVAAPVARRDSGEGNVGSALSASLSSAKWLLAASLAGGAIFVVLALLWLWWRGPAVSEGGRPASAAVEPPVPETFALSDSTAWSKLQLCQVISCLAEAEGYRVTSRAGGVEADLALARVGETKPRILVLCLPAAAGVVSPRRVRELYAALTLEEVDAGWVVGIGGFSPEARAYAQEKNLEVIDARALADRLDELPPLARRRLLSREG